MATAFADEAIRIRDLGHLSDTQVAQATGAAPSTVRDWFRGRSSPTGIRAERVAELAEIVDKYGDERRTRIVPAEGDLTAEDLIPEEHVVVNITRGGYAKRTKADLYRSQRRGGKGVRGAQLREDDVVEQFFVTTTHHWILFFTNRGRVYRAKAY